MRPVALAVLALVAAIALVVAHPWSRGGGRPALDHRACAYTDHSIAELGRFGRLAGRPLDCALVYNDTAPDWRAWERPWFLSADVPDHAWARWLRAGDDQRQLVVTQSLFPAAENDRDWLGRGSRGAYTGHARALARNLVHAGLGSVVIRLGHEANGTWYADSVTDDPRSLARWRALWRRTAQAMDSVDGAHFMFDWTVNAAVRPIAPARFYPGDDVVDVIGIDAYDTGLRARTGRWGEIYRRRGGVRDLERFARRHRKPLAFPEWGVAAAGGRAQAGGDDPAYVDGLARVARRSRFAYQAYFFKDEWRDGLFGSPRSRQAYRRHFVSEAR